MNRVLLNIGLWLRDTQDERRVHSTLRVVENCFSIHRLALVRPDCYEPTLVVDIRTVHNLLAADRMLYDISLALEQDCIARRFMCGATGDLDFKLVGPNAGAWGAFDHSKFHLL